MRQIVYNESGDRVTVVVLALDTMEADVVQYILEQEHIRLLGLRNATTGERESGEHIKEILLKLNS